LVAALRASTRHKLWVAGGVASRDDLAALAELGVDGVVVGTALYTGTLNPEGLNEEAWS
jgi:phosphoribosylformimino-5-aminoimidazole carboxamide ribonucleotide (ProFAR) isomerase